MWLEIFRTGTHTDSSGNDATYTVEDLSQIAELYNNNVMSDPNREAPLVKGHPKSDAPAYGWIERLARRGDRLVAKVRSLASEVLDEIREGRYRNVSIALYPDKMLRHVGLLGAVAPAVKGLNMLSFSERDFSDYEADLTIADDIISESKSDEFSDLDVESVMRENEQLKAKLSQLEAERNDMHSKLSEMKRLNRERAIKEFAETTLKSVNGSMFSAYQSAELRSLLEEASELEETLCEQGHQSEFSLTDRIKSFVLSLKPMVLGKEIATKQDAVENLSQFSGKNTIPERLRLHELAKEIQLENPTLSYEEAVIIANRTNFSH